MESNKIGNASLFNQIESLKNSRASQTPALPEVKKGEAKDFAELLTEQFSTPTPQANSELRFSSHAKTRLQSRGIELSPEDMIKLQDAVGKAQQKGSRESLILSDKGAFIVSVKNNTVITAVDKDSMKENLFTNIDSTILI